MPRTFKRGRKGHSSGSATPPSEPYGKDHGSNPLELDELCNRYAAILELGLQAEVSATLSEFSGYLRWLRKQADDQEWWEAEKRILGHRLADLMVLDPFTHHARQSGSLILSDPELLDFIYGGGRSTRSLQNASPIGRKIFAYNHSTKRSKALRQQRAMIGEHVASTLSGRDTSRIAAVGCGYLRELYSIAWNVSLPVDLFLAVDKDWRITASVRRQGFHPPLKTLAATPFKVAHFGLGQSGFDLIYSLGALDQMDDVIAEKFVRTLAGHLAPGGQLFLCSSLPDTPDAVFQEVMLSQKLHARTLSDVERIAHDLRRQPGFQVLLKDDPCGEFCNLTVTRF